MKVFKVTNSIAYQGTVFRPCDVTCTRTCSLNSKPDMKNMDKSRNKIEKYQMERFILQLSSKEDTFVCKSQMFLYSLNLSNLSS